MINTNILRIEINNAQIGLKENQKKIILLRKNIRTITRSLENAKKLFDSNNNTLLSIEKIIIKSNNDLSNLYSKRDFLKNNIKQYTKILTTINKLCLKKGIKESYDDLYNDLNILEIHTLIEGVDYIKIQYY